MPTQEGVNYTLHVTVQNPLGAPVSHNFAFVYNPRVDAAWNPTDTAPSPLLISVHNVDTNTTGYVRFFGNSQTPTYVSSTQMSCTIPSGSGTVPLAIRLQNGITNPNMDFTREFTFTVSALPTVTSIDPTAGTDGTIITITGTNFDPTTTGTVLFDGTAGTDFTVVQYNTLRITVPVLQTSGVKPLDITITTTGGQVHNTSLTFTHTARGWAPETKRTVICALADCRLTFNQSNKTRDSVCFSQIALQFVIGFYTEYKGSYSVPQLQQYTFSFVCNCFHVG